MKGHMSLSCLLKHSLLEPRAATRVAGRHGGRHNARKPMPPGEVLRGPGQQWSPVFKPRQPRNQTCDEETSRRCQSSAIRIFPAEAPVITKQRPAILAMSCISLTHRILKHNKIVGFFLATRTACGSSQARDRTCRHSSNLSHCSHNARSLTC